MMTFLYYVGGEKTNVTRERLIEVGLGHAFADVGFAARGCNKGPDGGSGVIVTDNRMGADRIGYYPERQKWTRFGESLVWCGFGEGKPGPDELRRERGLEGHYVELADGRRWLAPCAIACESVERLVNNLPQHSSLGPDGKWTVGETVEQYVELWRIACRWRDCWLQALEHPGDGAAVSVGIEFDELHNWAVTALAINYRISAWECSALGLFTAAAARDVLLALIDWPTWTAYLEKKTAGGLTAPDAGPGG